MGEFVELEKAYNVRDIGGVTARGGTVKSGLVFRGDSLEDLSDRDKKVLFDTCKISTVIDLRTLEERVTHRPLPAGVEDCHLSLLDEGRIGIEPFPAGDPESLAAVYLDNAIRGRQRLAKIFAVIADSVSKDKPVLFHCAAGRDRTGVIAGLLLSALGVDDELVVQDYTQSNTNARQVTAKLEENTIYADSPLAKQEIVKVDPRTMAGFLRLLDRDFGSAEGLLLQQGVTHEVLTSLRENLVA